MSGSRRRLVLLEHISLDGFLAGPNGEMEWIRVDDEIWEYVNPIAQRAGAAVFGRVTYQMMEPYWPTAGDSPDASRHDVDHSRWLNSASKLVFSNTLGSAPWGESASATLVTAQPLSSPPDALPAGGPARRHPLPFTTPDVTVFSAALQRRAAPAVTRGQVALAGAFVSGSSSCSARVPRRLGCRGAGAAGGGMPA